MHGDNHDGQRSVDLLIGNWHLLRSVWYPYFKPNPNATKAFKVTAWKVATTASGEVPGKPVFLREVDGTKTYSASYKDMGKLFVPERYYCAVLAHNGYKIAEKGSNYISFVRE